MSDLLPDIPRFVTAWAEWLACVVYILVLPRRFNWWQTAVLLAGGLAVLLGVQHLAGALPLGLWVLGMLLAVAAMFGLVALTVRMSLRDVGYITARAFVLAELVASLEWQVHAFYFRADLYSAGALALMTVVFAVAFGAAYLLERRQFTPPRAPEIGYRTLAMAISIAVITFALSNLSFVTPNTPFSGEVSIEVFYIRTLVDLCGYIALYAQHEQYRKHRADAELAAMNAMLRAQHEQYLQSRRDVEQASRIYHDLKHQVVALRAELDPAARLEHLGGLEETIDRFAATFDTGNPVVDAVLTAKARHCAANDITLTVVADGSRLGFVEPMDLAALLGNALDNAVEATLRLTDVEQRLIRVAIYEQGGFVVLRFENYFDGGLSYQGGELATRKSGGRHGIGVKSLRYTAAKYGGEAAVTAADNWFTCTVLLPLAG